MKEYIELTKQTALRAGKIILQYYNLDYNIENKSKEGFDPVTTADRKSNEFICNFLYKNGPVAGILSEEKLKTNDLELKRRTTNPFSYNLVWIIDPLDGTLGFVRKNSEFGVHIALIRGNDVILGVNYFPLLNELYLAYDDKSFLIKDNNIVNISVSNIDSLSKAMVLDSKNHPDPMIKILKDKKIISNIRLVGSAGYKSCLIAKGDAELYLRTSYNLSIWDVCSSIPIVKNSGGFIGNMDGTEINVRKIKTNGFIVCNGFLVDKILDVIKEN